MEGVNASTWEGPVALGAGAISTSSWREGSLRPGRESSYSAGVELPDGGGDAWGGVSGKLGEPKGPLHPCHSLTQKYQGLLSNPLSLSKKNSPPSSGIYASLRESLPLSAKHMPTHGSHDRLSLGTNT